MSTPYDGPGGVTPKKSRANPPCGLCGAAKRGVYRRRCHECGTVVCWQCSDKGKHWPFCTSDCEEAKRVRMAIEAADRPPRRWHGILRGTMVPV